MKNFCKWVIIIFLVIALIYLYNKNLKVEGFGPQKGGPFDEELLGQEIETISLILPAQLEDTETVGDEEPWLTWLTGDSIVLRKTTVSEPGIGINELQTYVPKDTAIASFTLDPETNFYYTNDDNNFILFSVNTGYSKVVIFKKHPNPPQWQIFYIQT